MRVLQLISSGGFYGAENMVLNLSAALERAGCETSLLVFDNLHRHHLEVFEQAQRRGLKARIVSSRGRIDRRAIQTIREHLQNEKADVLHTHGYKADLYGYAAARNHRIPLVGTCHNWLDRSSALRLYQRLDRWVLKRFNAVVAVSDQVAAKLLGAGVVADKLCTVFNGVDAGQFQSCLPSLPKTLDGPVLGIVARLDMSKGFEYLLRAIQPLTSLFPGLRLLIVGEGPDRPIIEGLVQQLGLQGNVLLTGDRNDMPGIYASFDIFVLPSLDEGLPMTLLEAMAAAKPVIATRVGAIPRVINDGLTGVLVDPVDVVALRDAISALLDRPEQRAQMGQRARLSVEQRFTADIMARRYLEIYRGVMNGNPGLAGASSEAGNNAVQLAGVSCETVSSKNSPRLP